MPARKGYYAARAWETKRALASMNAGTQYTISLLVAMRESRNVSGVGKTAGHDGLNMVHVIPSKTFPTKSVSYDTSQE